MAGKNNNMADYLSRVEINTIELENKSEILKAHQLTGHSCANITFMFMKQQNMKMPSFKCVQDVIRRCEQCLKKNRQSVFKSFPLVRSAPFAMIGIDCMGPLPTSDNGNKWIILATDYATGWCEGRAMKTKSAKNVFKFLLEDIFCNHGPPVEIRSDMGKEFTAKIIEAISKYWTSKMKYTAPYAPYSNGRAERSNQTLIGKLSKLLTETRKWDLVLQVALFSYRISPCSRTKISPFELLYGRKPLININEDEFIKESIKFLNDDELLKAREENFKFTSGIIRDKNLRHIQELERKNAGKKDPEDIILNDVVLVRKRFVDGKFDDKWYGPFIVIDVAGKGTFSVLSSETGLVLKVARRDLKLFNSSTDSTALPVLNNFSSDMEFGKGGLWTNCPIVSLL